VSSIQTNRSAPAFCFVLFFLFFLADPRSEACTPPENFSPIPSELVEEDAADIRLAIRISSPVTGSARPRRTVPIGDTKAPGTSNISPAPGRRPRELEFGRNPPAQRKMKCHDTKLRIDDVWQRFHNQGGLREIESLCSILYDFGCDTSCVEEFKDAYLESLAGIEHSGEIQRRLASRLHEALRSFIADVRAP